MIHDTGRIAPVPRGLAPTPYRDFEIAFRAVAAGKIDQGAQLLERVKNPTALVGSDRAYFELASGFVCAARGRNADAEQHLRLALESPLRSEDDRALGEAVLAQLLVAREQYGEAGSLLDQAAGRCRRSAIADRIRALR